MLRRSRRVLIFFKQCQNGIHQISLLLLLLLFLTFSVLVANPKKLLYMVANPARDLLNRGKKKKKKKKKMASQSPPPPPPSRSTIGGRRGCNKFVPVLGRDGTRTAPPGTYLTNSLVK